MKKRYNFLLILISISISIIKPVNVWETIIKATEDELGSWLKYGEEREKWIMSQVEYKTEPTFAYYATPLEGKSAMDLDPLLRSILSSSSNAVSAAMYVFDGVLPIEDAFDQMIGEIKQNFPDFINKNKISIQDLYNAFIKNDISSLNLNRQAETTLQPLFDKYFKATEVKSTASFLAKEEEAIVQEFSTKFADRIMDTVNVIKTKFPQASASDLEGIRINLTKLSEDAVRIRFNELKLQSTFPKTGDRDFKKAYSLAQFIYARNPDFDISLITKNYTLTTEQISQITNIFNMKSKFASDLNKYIDFLNQKFKPATTGAWQKLKNLFSGIE